MRLVIAIGARPNIIKVGPLLPELRRAGITAQLAYCGPGVEGGLEGADGELEFFGVRIPAPRWYLGVDCEDERGGLGTRLSAFEALFSQEHPDVVMVVGESDSAVAAGISAARAGIPVVHLEAGLRCGDMREPEELNRVILSRLSAMHLTPTERALENLEDEGIEPERIHFVGNLMAESVLRHKDEIARTRACGEYGLTEREYVLASFHRDNNVRDVGRWDQIVGGLERSSLPVLMPDADGLASAVGRLGRAVRNTVRIVESVPYRMMLSLERDAAAIITDSGGVQVEACMFGVPCVTVRECTEFDATIDVGANRLVDAEASAIFSALAEATAKQHSWRVPIRWDRAVSDRVARVLKRGVTPLV